MSELVKMPSKKQYNLVQNDENDTRIPFHPEEAFQHGITFQAKVSNLTTTFTIGDRKRVQERIFLGRAGGDRSTCRGSR